MNTAQLIVLWYAGLIVFVILSFKALDSSNVNYFVVAIILINAILIYTFRPHPNARKKRVLVAVVTPIMIVPLLFVIFSWYGTYQEKKKERVIKLEEVELGEVLLNSRFGSLSLSGRIKNKSPHILVSADIEVDIREGTEVVERKSIKLYEDIPPGETRNFNEYIRLNTPIINNGTWDKRFTWEYYITELKGEVSQK